MAKNIIKINEAQLKKIVAESVKKVLMESQAKYYPGVWLYDKADGSLGGDMGYEFCDAGSCVTNNPKELIDNIKEGLDDYAAESYEERDDRFVKICYVSLYGGNNDAPFGTFYISNVDKAYFAPVKMALERKYHKPVKVEII